MLEKIKDGINLAGNMGFRYMAYRTGFEIKKKSGLIERNFPTNPQRQIYFTLDQWRKSDVKFFFPGKDEMNFPIEPSIELEERFQSYKEGKILLFNSFEHDFGKEVNWFKNPDEGFEYPKIHWTKINDYSEATGDIKFVWERARFSFIYDIIRYDYHFREDCSAIVLNEMLSWIRNNPINIGPNYRCSQEISIRLMNWYFCLNYYKHSDNLTEEIFNEIQFSIYWQLHHVFHNINFSRIAVRNNHAITETLALFISGILYPYVSDFVYWSKKGKKWFEQEIHYQIYPDGTFLQFSMNYHRVVIQLLTWAIRISEINGIVIDSFILERAEKSLMFLQSCTNENNGMLPNYGANDGALFFKLNNDQYRDYRSQLNALSFVLHKPLQYEGHLEDSYWYGMSKGHPILNEQNNGIFHYPNGGYIVIREKNFLTFLRCGTHKDRPSQADNLHLDCWVNENNILMDAGTYKYNTEPKILKYFMGTESHNTLKIEDYDQMKKGSRFIWFYWTKCKLVEMLADGEQYKITVEMEGFRQVGKNIRQRRTIFKQKNKPVWEVTDEMINLPDGLKIRQLWHTLENKVQHLKIVSVDSNNSPISLQYNKGWVSNLYGKMEDALQLEAETKTSKVITTIEFKLL